MSEIIAAKRAKVDDNELPLDLSLKSQSAASIKINHDNKSSVVNNHQHLEDDVDDDTNLIELSFALADIPSKLLALEYELTKRIEHITFGPPVEYIYSPIEYALSVHSNFLQKYCRTTKKILFLAMNPGPWGMSQTGIPFGEINAVVNWLKVSGFIEKPSREQPDKKITGFACTRSEISGRRFWNLFKDMCGNPENFFQYSFLRNYCPVALMDAGGRNITPAELKGPEQKELRDVCDLALLAIIKLLKVEKIVGIGRFAEQRAKNVIKVAGLTTKIFWMPHPSPRSTGNENWSEKAIKTLHELNLLQFFTNNNKSNDQGRVS
ncbi:single-strand selective monofunctional uracil DNA glycosylase [Chelonus insularis]|uniref:single-strand selective monofunctional uracil DNA glycosylase n=1 Tax=Chelonus insularis TaxID=460826 RepID=UPI001589B89E|nr:single-strand selective monofunctional uracil DNA glycosylase [Chelonus insularis]